jgi:hypothetical protein
VRAALRLVGGTAHQEPAKRRERSLLSRLRRGGRAHGSLEPRDYTPIFYTNRIGARRATAEKRAPAFPTAPLSAIHVFS